MSVPWSSYYSKYFWPGWGYRDWSYRWFLRKGERKENLQ